MSSSSSQKAMIWSRAATPPIYDVRMAAGKASAGVEAGRDPFIESLMDTELFTDMQCSNCRSQFLATVPSLVEGDVRDGKLKLELRHYSVSESPEELGFFGAEAAARQGYGWQYTYLFFQNQDEARRLSVDE